MFLYCSKNMRLSITTNNYFAERFVIHRDSHKQRVGNVPQNVCNIEGQTNVSRELTESETLKKRTEIARRTRLKSHHRRCPRNGKQLHTTKFHESVGTYARLTVFLFCRFLRLFHTFFPIAWPQREVAIIHAPSTSTTKSFLSTSKSVSRPVSFAFASVPLACCGSQTTVHHRKIPCRRAFHLHRLQGVEDAEINSIYRISRRFQRTSK